MDKSNHTAAQQGYARFIPHQMLQLLWITNIDDVQLGENVEKEVTLIFSNIRDFTALSSTMMSSAVFRFINSYTSHL